MMGETYEIVEFIIDNFQHLNLRMHPPSLNSLRDAAKIEESMLFNVCEIERLLTLHLSNEPSSFHQHTSSNPSSHTYLDELVATEDYEAWAEKHLKHTGDIKASSLFFMASSCGVLYKINEEREVSFLDVISTCGNTCIAVCEETLGEKDFGKVIKLAEKGDIRKVSLFAEDVKSEEGCYRAKCDFVIFNLGKLASNNLKGKDQYVSYTREDLAAGLLDYFLHMLANSLVLQALLHSVHTIYAHGSLFQSAYIRQVFEKYVLKDSLQAYVAKGKPLKIHFFENSCFMDSLNVWMKNVEKEKKRIINMESKI